MKELRVNGNKERKGEKEKSDEIYVDTCKFISF